jgi:hypothetical protein
MHILNGKHVLSVDRGSTGPSWMRPGPAPYCYFKMDDFEIACQSTHIDTDKRVRSFEWITNIYKDLAEYELFPRSWLASALLIVEGDVPCIGRITTSSTGLVFPGKDSTACLTLPVDR